MQDPNQIATGYMQDCELAQPPELVEAPKPNRQLFDNSRLSSSIIEQDCRDNPDGLYDDKNPNLAILHERPWHRAVVYLVIKGMTNREIAARFGKTEPWISQLTRQPWFKERVVKELKDSGGDLIEALLEAQAVPSLEKVIALRDGSEDERIQMTAAKELLDRFLGKPTQHVEQKISADYKHTLSNVSDIDRELQIVESQLRTIQPSVGLLEGNSQN